MKTIVVSQKHLVSGQTTRVCGDSHEPILVRSNNVVLFVKGANATNAFVYDLTLQGKFWIHKVLKLHPQHIIANVCLTFNG